MPQKKCSRCGRAFDTGKEENGGLVKCPSCGQEVQTPEAAGEKKSALDFDLEELSLETEKEAPEQPAAAEQSRSPGPEGTAPEPSPERATPMRTQASQASRPPCPAEPEAIVEEDELEPAQLLPLIGRCLLRPGAIAQVGLHRLGRKEVLISLAVVFLILSVAPCAFDAARTAGGFFDFIKAAPAVYFLRAIIMAVYIALVKLLMVQYGSQDEDPPAAAVAGGLLLSRCLGIIWFAPLALLSIAAIALTPAGVAGVVVALAWLAFAGVSFFYQAYVLRELFGAGCLGMVVINAVGIYATHHTAAWFVAKYLV